jgi:hypothetical protein
MLGYMPQLSAIFTKTPLLVNQMGQIAFAANRTPNKG